MNDKKENDIIEPIQFVKKPIEFVTKPVEFVKKPISFMAYQKDNKGEMHEVIVENPSLANSVIPSEISIEKFEQLYQSLIANGNDKIMHKEEDGDELIGQTPKPTKKKRNLYSLTNYELKPVCKRIYKDRDGKIDYSRNEILVQILITEKGQFTQAEFWIKCVEIDKITKIIGKNYPTAIIYNKKDAIDVENSFRAKTSSLDNIICYTDAGWQNIGGKNVFVHKSCRLANAEIMTPLDLPSYSNYRKQDIANIWRMSLDIYIRHEVAAVLNIYSFLGVAYKLFEEAGFPPHFLLFMNGKTGSLKTTIAKILYTQLANEEYREFPRRIDSDTPTSLERALVLTGQDNVTLIDDYAPAKTLRKKNDMADNLESIIRMVGDGSTKSRSNINLDDCRGKGVKGVVVLTGELRGKGLSSNLRCLYCEIERENVITNTVTWFQNNRYAYTTMIQHFTYYLSSDWINVVSYIKEQIEPKRREAEKYLKERRLVDTLVTLWIMSDIVGRFLVQYCEMSEKFVRLDVKPMKDELVSVVVRSEMLSNEENPARVFMKAVITMMNSNKIHIASERLNSSEVSYMDGFEDDTYVYLMPENIYPKVIAWLKMGGLYFGVELNQLGSILVNDGYAVPTSNGANKKLNYARIDVGESRKVKFIKIPKDVIRQLQEASEHNE